MAICDNITRKKTQVCLGSLTRIIDIYERALTPPIDPLTGQFLATETFTLVSSPWTMVETPTGLTIFDSIGQERVVNTVFTIPYQAGLTSENWIIYDGNRYDILNIIDFQTNHLFLQINCALSGAESKEGGEA